MISLLREIVATLVCWIETAAVTVINALIVAIAALISGVLALCPSLPDLPPLPTPLADGLAFANYYFPLDWFMTEFFIFITFALAWWALAIPLRWAKGIRSDA